MSYPDAVAEGWRDQAKRLGGQVSDLCRKVRELEKQLADATARYGGLVADLTTLHSEYRIYDECDHNHPEDDPARVDCGDFVTCEEGYLYSVCAACCTEPEYGQTEQCAGAHDHRPSAPLCPTIAALAARERAAA